MSCVIMRLNGIPRALNVCVNAENGRKITRWIHPLDHIGFWSSLFSY